MRSPTERALRYLRASDYSAGVVEQWVPMFGAEPRPGGGNPGVRRDLFGCIDIIAVHEDGQTLAIQCTSVGGMSDRYRKMRGLEPIKATDEKKRKRLEKQRDAMVLAIRRCLLSGWTLAIWGFDKGMKRPKVRYFTLSDLPQPELPL